MKKLKEVKKIKFISSNKFSDDEDFEDTHLGTNDLKSFSYLEDGSIYFSTLKILKTVNVLDRGIYRIYADDSNGNLEIKIQEKKIDEVKTLPSFPKKEYLDAIIENFFDEEVKKYLIESKTPLNFGFLLHGKEGTGKTSIIFHYLKKIVEENSGIAFILDSFNCEEYISNIWDFISKIRKIQNNPIIIFLDECEELFKNREATIKTILDGSDSIDNVLLFASTNYLSVIPNSIKNRPSRIKYSIEIGVVKEIEVVRDIIMQIMPEISEDELIDLSKKLKDKTVDEIKQRCVDIIMNLDHFKTESIGFKI